MKKLILAACLMAGAAFASFGAVQMNVLGSISAFPSMGDYRFVTFTFDSDGSYGLEFGRFIPTTLTAFGYFFIDDPDTLISGTFTGNTSDYFSTYTNMLVPLGLLADVDTGYLGEFKAGDTIGIWIEQSSSKFPNEIWTSTDTGGFKNGVYDNGDGLLRREEGIIFRFVGMDNPNPSSGAPLPGVMAALAIGGCAFLGRKIRGRATRSN